MEEAADLVNDLPLSFKTPKEQEYLEFLRDAWRREYARRFAAFVKAGENPVTVTAPALQA